MKCISLKQPWATLWVLGVKIFETRSWYMSHRGWIGVHASKSDDVFGRSLWESVPIRMAVASQKEFDPQIGLTEFDSLPRGVIIGRVFVDNCFRMTEKKIEEQTDLEFLVGDWKTGRFAIHTTDRSFFDPIVCRGQLGVFEYDPEKEQEYRRQKQQQFVIARAKGARRRKKPSIIDALNSVHQAVQLPLVPQGRIKRKFEL